MSRDCHSLQRAIQGKVKELQIILHLRLSEGLPWTLDWLSGLCDTS